MATPPSELRLITAAKNLAAYLFQVLERAPKKFRYSLVTRLENKSLYVVEAQSSQMFEKRQSDAPYTTAGCLFNL